jgi:hypothetical protein
VGPACPPCTSSKILIPVWCPRPSPSRGDQPRATSLGSNPSSLCSSCQRLQRPSAPPSLPPIDPTRSVPHTYLTPHSFILQSGLTSFTQHPINPSSDLDRTHTNAAVGIRAITSQVSRMQDLSLSRSRYMVRDTYWSSQDMD